VFGLTIFAQVPPPPQFTVKHTVAATGKFVGASWIVTADFVIDVAIPANEETRNVKATIEWVDPFSGANVSTSKSVALAPPKVGPTNINQLKLSVFTMNPPGTTYSAYASADRFAGGPPRVKQADVYSTTTTFIK
jgi:hypothetical protein